MSWLTNYNYRKQITIDSSKINSDLADFPVLVKLTSTNFDFSKAQSNGNDIRFTSSDGMTLLKYERERHDSTNQVAEYWIKIPSISSSTNTTFYIYYDNSSASDGTDPTNVWDMNTKGAWHLNQDPSGTAPQELDSTMNNNDGTSNGSMTSDDLVEGQIAQAQDFDGTDDYVDCGNKDSLDITDAITIEAWVKPFSTNSDWPMVVAKWSGTSYYELYTLDIQNYKLGSEVTTPNGNFYRETTNDVVTLNEWQHLAMSYNSATNVFRLYRNGAVVQEWMDVSGTISTSIKDLTIGGILRDSLYNKFNGTIDEVRISDTAHSTAWIKASYNSGNDSLNTFGNEEQSSNSVFFGTNF